MSYIPVFLILILAIYIDRRNKDIHKNYKLLKVFLFSYLILSIPIVEMATFWNLNLFFPEEFYPLGLTIFELMDKGLIHSDFPVYEVVYNLLVTITSYLMSISISIFLFVLSIKKEIAIDRKLGMILL